MTLRRLWLIAVLGSLACGTLLATRIGDIRADPRHFDGRVVTVKGEVRRPANLLLLRTYVVADGTGEITVVTERAVPRGGERVRVQGLVKQAFAVGNAEMLVLVEKR